MGDKRPQIINCAGIYFFMTPIHGSMGEFTPNQLVDYATGPWIGPDGSYFAVGICDFTPQSKERIRAALEYIWNQLVERDLATGDMPVPVIGDPRAMLS